MRRLLLPLVLSLLCGCSGGGTAVTAPSAGPRPAAPPAATSPSPHARIPSDPKRLSTALALDVAHLRPDIEAWLRTSPARNAVPPVRLQLEALYQQRTYRFLARHPRLIAPALRHMPHWLRPEARDSAGALHALFTLTGHPTEVRFRTGPPRPPGELRSYYREGQRRFRVRWNVLAAVNMIESNFGRLRNTSNAGAVGPMQFLPATWRSYGMGGNIRDPHDAILGAANYLRASGAPRSYSAAVFHYNPSRLYVRAVLRFAHRMGRDRRAYYAYWSWQSFRREGHRDVQLSGPGS